MNLLQAIKSTIETTRDIIEGVRALPACADAVRELSEFSREANQSYRDTLHNLYDSRLTNVRRYLSNIGIDAPAIERILDGEEIESDYLTSHDFDNLRLINERDEQRKRAELAEAKLEWLTRPRRQAEEPCQFPPETRVFYRDRTSFNRWSVSVAGDLEENDEWCPITLDHFDLTAAQKDAESAPCTNDARAQSGPERAPCPDLPNQP